MKDRVHFLLESPSSCSMNRYLMNEWQNWFTKFMVFNSFFIWKSLISLELVVFYFSILFFFLQNKSKFYSSFQENERSRAFSFWITLFLPHESLFDERVAEVDLQRLWCSILSFSIWKHCIIIVNCVSFLWNWLYILYIFFSIFLQNKSKEYSYKFYSSFQENERSRAFSFWIAL